MPISITIPDNEYWDERAEEFIQVKGETLLLEHSLASVAKWESKWKKPFFSDMPMTSAEFVDYVRQMTLEPVKNDLVYRGLEQRHARLIEAYIEDPMTATWFKKKEGTGKGRPTGKVTTAEIIYYNMIELGIPFECQYWHLNRLMTLIRVCAEKKGPQKKMSQKEVLSQYGNLNAARRAKLGTKG